MSDKITRTATVQLTTDYDDFDFDNFTDYIQKYAETETDYHCDVRITSTTDWSEPDAVDTWLAELGNGNVDRGIAILFPFLWDSSPIGTDLADVLRTGRAMAATCYSLMHK